MIRSVHVETHTEAIEPPTLFDGQHPPLHDYINYRIRFEFRENDTMVYHRSIHISTRPRDWHFKSRLREAIKKDIKDDSDFKMTQWNVRDKFTYNVSLQDNVGGFVWLEKEILRAVLFDIR